MDDRSAAVARETSTSGGLVTCRSWQLPVRAGYSEKTTASIGNENLRFRIELGKRDWLYQALKDR